MKIRPFQKDDFPTYQSWYRDPALDQALGPMDEEWLTYVLNQSPFAQFCMVDEERLLAVIGIEHPDDDHPWYTITDLAVDPTLKRTGVARQAVTAMVENFENDAQWVAFVEHENKTAAAFFLAIGWRVVSLNEDPSMLEFRR